MKPDRMQVSSLAATLLLTACGATRLEDAEWKSRAGALAEQRVTGDQQASVLAHSSGALLTGTRVNFVIERGPSGGAKQRWDVSLFGPMSLSKKGGHECTVDFNATLKDGVPFVGSRKAHGYPAILTVSSENRPPQPGDSFLPLGLMACGLLDSCEVASPPLEPADVEAMTAEEQATYLTEYMSHFFPLLAMSQMANDSPAIRKLMLETIQFPSWWSLLTLSINVSPVLDVQGAERVDTVHGEGFRIPFELKINGDPALYATITAVEPRGALILTSGIIAVDGFAPNRPDEVLTIRFVGSEQLPTAGPPERMSPGYISFTPD